MIILELQQIIKSIYNIKTRNFIIPVIGNIILFVMILSHTHLIKGLLLYLGVYESSNYLKIQGFLEIVLLLFSYFVFLKQKRNKYLFYCFYFLLHYSVFYLISIVSLYIIDPVGCMQIMFDLLKKPFIIITRVGITFTNLYLIFRYSQYLSKPFILSHYIILLVLIVLSLI